MKRFAPCILHFWCFWFFFIFIINISVSCYIWSCLTLSFSVFPSSSSLFMLPFKAYHIGTARNWQMHCSTAGPPSNAPHVVLGKDDLLFSFAWFPFCACVCPDSYGFERHQGLRINVLINLFRPSELVSSQKCHLLHLTSSLLSCPPIITLAWCLFIALEISDLSFLNADLLAIFNTVGYTNVCLD